MWWWKYLWKLRCPGKAKLLFWAILENKAPTWDILQKHFLQGPGICPLCRDAEETIAHLFVQCRFSQAVWDDISKYMDFKVRWRGESVLEAFHLWWSLHKSSSIRAFPCIFAWGIWITRNQIIFHDRRVPMESVVAHAVAVLQHYKAPVQAIRTRPVRVEQFDKSMPWAFFDGASLNHQSVCGGGGVLYKTESHYFHLVAGLGRGSNNYAELMSLKLLMLFALEQGCLSLQIFGDSMLVIDWAKETTHCQVMVLLPILEEVIRLKQSFNHITFTHVYRERNGLADQLSKDATQQDLALGTWRITIHSPGGTFSYYHRPFHDDIEAQH